MGMTTAKLLAGQQHRIEWRGEGDRREGELFLTDKQVRFLWRLWKKERSDVSILLEDMRVEYDGHFYKCGRVRGIGRYMHVTKIHR